VTEETPLVVPRVQEWSLLPSRSPRLMRNLLSDVGSHLAHRDLPVVVGVCVFGETFQEIVRKQPVERP
jgi:hypothetical protein